MKTTKIYARTFIRQNALPRLSPACYRLILLLTLPTSLLAEPSVTGNIITMPEDGWYQVQSAQDFSEICQGVTQCTVPDGEYIVINHTSGQRFESVLVGTPKMSQPPGEPIVSNGRISWSDDGWYQVQNQSNYESLCEGGTFCDVPPGRYIVINHTENLRWEDIAVNSSPVTNPPPVVANLTYQRYSPTAAELFWEHPPGVPLPQIYTVFRDGTEIGNTDGSSYFDDALLPFATAEYTISLGVNPSQSVSINVPFETKSLEDSSITESNAVSILQNIADIINLDAVDGLFRDAQSDLNFQGSAFFISNTIEDIEFQQRVDVDTPYFIETDYLDGAFIEVNARSDYSCALGGGLHYYFATGVGSDTIFTDCVAGNHQWSGLAGIRQQVRGERTHYPYSDFSATGGPDGSVRTLSGGLTRGNTSFVALQGSSSWKALEYSETDNLGNTLNISNYFGSRTHYSDIGFQGNQQTVPLADGTTVTVQLNRVSVDWFADFDVTAPWTNGATFSVSATLSFSDSIRLPTEPTTADISGLDPAEDFNWQTVVVNITADDGSSLLVIGSESGTGEFFAQLGAGDSIGPLIGPLQWDEVFDIVCEPDDTVCY